MFVFKKLSKVADQQLIRMVYRSLCQSILSYCIAVWGIAPKTHMIKLERAQRAILKIAYRRPRRYPTDKLYLECQFLRVRQLYIGEVVLLFHKSAKSRARISGRSVKWDYPKIKTAYARRATQYMGPYLYTKIFKAHNDILNMIRSRCRFTVQKWLQSHNYDETEALLQNQI